MSSREDRSLAWLPHSNSAPVKLIFTSQCLCHLLLVFHVILLRGCPFKLKTNIIIIIISPDWDYLLGLTHNCILNQMSNQ